MIKKTYFEAPLAELIVVRFEEGFLTNSPVSGGAGGDDTIVDDEENY